MRVAILSANAQRHNAVGNHVAEKVRFFQERGAEVRLFVQDARRLHPEVRAVTHEAGAVQLDGPVWDYLRQCDLIFAVYGQTYDLLQYLPALAGNGPRIVFDYLGVTPPSLMRNGTPEGLQESARGRGVVWCADHALTISTDNARELMGATQFPREHVTTLPLAVAAPSPAPSFPRSAWERTASRRSASRQDPTDELDAIANHQPATQERRDAARSHAERGNELEYDGPIVLYVGRLAGNKRVPLLIEALAQLDDPSPHVVIVGDCTDVYADEAARCVMRARELGVEDRVHLVGELSEADLARAYRSAAVLVIPSLHEGFCVPVIEAMAAGCPVIASRSAALPETVGDSGLTFVPDDARDLAQQLRRVLASWDRIPILSPRGQNDTSGIVSHGIPQRRIAIVSFRFGAEIVGGAETSLRTMANALQAAGHHVEVFTTCTKSESDWRNELPPGTSVQNDLTVHRFLVDPHQPTLHGEVVRAILEAGGRVAPDVEQRYVKSSIQSRELLSALRERQEEFDAILTGPYLFGLTADVAHEFANKTVVVPCFHDEPLARLALWPQRYGAAAGILFHSREEQEFAQTRLGVNHPNSGVVGTWLEMPAGNAKPLDAPRPYVVYCGRLSEQKNVPLLLDWARRYQAETPGALDVVFMGQGEVTLPRAPWLRDLGRVDDDTKRAVLAGALALVQLSRQESLSLVALEAWSVGTPIIVHRDCVVLAGQLQRADGGAMVGDYDSFAATLDDLVANPESWRQRGQAGRAYVEAAYGSRESFLATLMTCIDPARLPIRDIMRERGVARAQYFSRERWQQRFAEFVERVVSQPGRSFAEDLRVEPLRRSCSASRGATTMLLAVRLSNHGERAALPDGPARTVVCCEVCDDATGERIGSPTSTPLPGLMMPGQSRVAALPLTVPDRDGAYVIRICLWRQDSDRADPNARPARSESYRHAEIALTVGREHERCNPGAAAPFLDGVAQSLPRAQQMQSLPDGYVDVTEGAFAPLKRLVKRKLLHNFKHAYVDVLSRQQSQVNEELVLMVQQLAECCAALDHTVATLHERVHELEAKLEDAVAEEAHG